MTKPDHVHLGPDPDARDAALSLIESVHRGGDHDAYIKVIMSCDARNTAHNLAGIAVLLLRELAKRDQADPESILRHLREISQEGAAR